MVVSRQSGTERQVIRSAFLATVFVLPLFSAALPLGAVEYRGSVATDVPATGAASMSIETFGRHFIENRGQIPGKFSFYTLGNPSVAFSNEDVMYVVREESREEGAAGRDAEGFRSSPAASGSPIRSLAYSVEFYGAKHVEPIGLERLHFTSNFFIGADRDMWRIGVPAYRAILYPNLYDGIDLMFRLESRGVKYEFVVGPGADPDQIEMRLEGVDAIVLNQANLSIMTAAGEMHDSLPYSYQEGGGEITCAFILKTASSYGFECGGWNRLSALHIDPLVYSTFLGGSGWDHGYSIKADSQGCAYVTGSTFSPNFPTTPGSFDSVLGGTDDTFVTKLNASGTGLIYSTYIGGNGSDSGLSIALGQDMQTYVSGETSSPDFPTTPGAFDETYNGRIDNFVLELNPAGSALVFSTFIGGTENDTWPTVATDAAGNVYLAGITASPSFPVTNGSFATGYGGGSSDAFVLKLDPSATSLVYASFLGGADADFAYSIAVDLSEQAYITGGEWSLDFPTTNGAFDTANRGASDVFVTKVSVTCDSLVYSTLLGGSDYDVGLSVAVDRAGFAYVTGATNSADFPATPGAFDTTYNSIGWNDAFIAKLNLTGGSLAFSTYLGGAEDDFGNAIALDAAGHIYLAGGTTSSDFPITPYAFQRAYGGLGDSFMTKLDEGGFPLNSTYFGGSGSEAHLPFMAIDDSGDLYLTGITNSSDLPITPGAFDTALNPGRDCFVAELRMSGIVSPFVRQIFPGHRLISIPVQPLNQSIGSVLSSINGCYDYARWYDASDARDPWKSYVPGRIHNDMTAIHSTMGFWLNVTRSCILWVAGTIEDSTAVNLLPGWNMIGFPSANSSFTVADLKAALGHIGARVETEDPFAAPYFLQEAADSYQMTAGGGYWVYVPSSTTWIVEW